MADAEEIAQAFHEAYERLAPDFGYRTREASAKPWAEVPENNRSLMTATVQSLLDDGAIAAMAARERPGPPPFNPDPDLIGHAGQRQRSHG